jgi:hypothetical protein
VRLRDNWKNSGKTGPNEVSDVVSAESGYAMDGLRWQQGQCMDSVSAVGSDLPNLVQA